jgi:hypothetical protein
MKIASGPKYEAPRAVRLRGIEIQERCRQLSRSFEPPAPSRQ